MSTMKKILIVEDDQFILDLYKRQLENAGYEILTAENGEKALQELDKSVNLILLDILLPKKGGLEILKDIKSNESVKNIPVILLTNLGQESIIKQAFELGASGYLIKSSITPSDVVHQVKEFLNND
ncbi:response regulator [candidate division WWE3 bacterium CG06_land_8_20_14_3_00_42_16]|uniref:Response regulator n=4 Tax=Katanobacteria TaxID=422282 RepID=A0A2M7ANX3_UNCKA|nr:MAG: response regulator [candidate division WWE3 bacterium CG06_land_8_20_14_3_00_42_16]PIZ43518.1 MAG: response regulator [candidate division WWE3 bacterium CG_4_10_14_0_2_um_filter_42_8]PJA37550.1 MAG: response regulator [candidate division WWE3 bacterium CG_4_9_14_3_um_filter_43_9]PJC69342.1 MAG: response regulator [candidate division WWE3 bacterium CG_4_8_14_3_um_filter_42_11]